MFTAVQLILLLPLIATAVLFSALSLSFLSLFFYVNAVTHESLDKIRNERIGLSWSL